MKFFGRALQIIGAVSVMHQTAYAGLTVMTTLRDLDAVVKEVAGTGNGVETDAFCKGTQDPHFLEAKPSFMVKANKADLYCGNRAWTRRRLAKAHNGRRQEPEDP